MTPPISSKRLTNLNIFALTQGNPRQSYGGSTHLLKGEKATEGGRYNIYFGLTGHEFHVTPDDGLISRNIYIE